MTTTSMKRLLVLAACVLLVGGLASCSSSGDDESTDGTSSATTEEAPSGEDAEADGETATGDLASPEVCDALAIGSRDPARIAEIVALFPEDLQDDVQEIFDAQDAYIATYDEATQTFEGEAPTPSDELAAFTASCTAADGSETSGATPEFEYSAYEDETYIVHGSCPDGSAPSDVQATGLALETEPTVAEDLGGGDYALVIPSLPDGFEDTAEARAEVGIPSLVTGTCG